MKRFYYACFFILLAAVVISCSKSNETELTETPGTGGGNTCDTTAMSFTQDIKPILQSNCYSCHSNATFAVSGIKLEDYADVKHHADDGDIMGTITHAAGYPAMPQGGAKLQSCTINKIKAWIDSGAPNN